MRRVAVEVASKDANPQQGVEHKQTSPVVQAAAAYPASQQTADTGTDVPKQKRLRQKPMPRKSAKRSKTAVVRGAIGAQPQTHTSVCRTFDRILRAWW